MLYILAKMPNLLKELILKLKEMETTARLVVHAIGMKLKL